MGRGISDDDAIMAAWTVQLPSLRLDMPLSSNDAFAQLCVTRDDKAYADMGIWLQLCSLASSATGHALPFNFDLISQSLFKTQGKSTVAAEHVNALIAAGLATKSEDEWLYLPAIDDAMIRHGKMIIGGTRGGRPRGKKKRR